MAYVFLTMAVFQGLTLIFLQSNACQSNPLLPTLAEDQSVLYSNTCNFGWGTKVNIAAVVFWFVAAVLMLTVIPPPVKPDRGPPETQTVTYTQTEQPDGTKVMTQTTVKGQYVEQPDKTDAAKSSPPIEEAVPAQDTDP